MRPRNDSLHSAMSLKQQDQYLVKKRGNQAIFSTLVITQLKLIYITNKDSHRRNGPTQLNCFQGPISTSLFWYQSVVRVKELQTWRVPKVLNAANTTNKQNLFFDSYKYTLQHKTTNLEYVCPSFLVEEGVISKVKGKNLKDWSEKVVKSVGNYVPRKTKKCAVRTVVLKYNC